MNNLAKRLEEVGVLEEKVRQRMGEVLVSAEKLFLTTNGEVAFMVKTPKLMERLLTGKDVEYSKQREEVVFKGRDRFLKNEVQRTNTVKNKEVSRINGDVRSDQATIEKTLKEYNKEPVIEIVQPSETTLKVNEPEPIIVRRELNTTNEHAPEVTRTGHVPLSDSIINGLSKVIKMQTEGKMVARSVTVCNIPVAMVPSAVVKDMMWMLNNRRMLFDSSKLEDKIFNTKWREKVNRSHCSITIELSVPIAFHFGVSDIGISKKYFCIMPGIKRGTKQALYMIQPCRPEFTAEEGGRPTGSQEAFKIRGVLNSEGSVNATLRAVKSYMAVKTRQLNIPKVELCVEVESFYVKGMLNHETHISVLLKKNGSSMSDRKRLRDDVFQGKDPVTNSIMLTISGWVLWISESKSRVDPPEAVNKVYFTTQLTKILPSLTLENVLEVISKEQPSVLEKIEDAFFNWQTFLNPTLFILWNQEPELIDLKVINDVCSKSPSMPPTQSNDKWLPGQWQLKSKAENQKQGQPAVNVIVKSYAAAAKASADEIARIKIREVAEESDKVKKDMEILVQRLASEKELLEVRIKLIETNTEIQVVAAVKKATLDNDVKVIEMRKEMKLINDQQVVNNNKNSEIVNLLKVLEENRLRDAALVKQIMGIADLQSGK